MVTVQMLIFLVMLLEKDGTSEGSGGSGVGGHGFIIIKYREKIDMKTKTKIYYNFFLTKIIYNIFI